MSEMSSEAKDCIAWLEDQEERLRFHFFDVINRYDAVFFIHLLRMMFPNPPGMTV